MAAQILLYLNTYCLCCLLIVSYRRAGHYEFVGSSRRFLQDRDLVVLDPGVFLILRISGYSFYRNLPAAVRNNLYICLPALLNSGLAGFDCGISLSFL